MTAVAYPDMNQVREHCEYQRQTSPDKSVTDTYTCKFCQKKFTVKIKGPGGNQKVTNTRPVKAHIMEKHNIQPAMLGDGEAASKLDELKKQYETKKSFKAMSCKLIKEFAIGNGAKNKSYEEYHRVIGEKLGAQAAADFETEFTKSQYRFGNSFMTGKGLHALSELNNRRRDFTINLRKKVAKALKVAKENIWTSASHLNSVNDTTKVQVSFRGSQQNTAQSAVSSSTVVYETTFPVPAGQEDPTSDGFVLQLMNQNVVSGASGDKYTNAKAPPPKKVRAVRADQKEKKKAGKKEPVVNMAGKKK